MIVDIPEAFHGLFGKHRYKVTYGGRGSAKSWSIARYLIARAMGSTVRILCCREFQSSIQQSVHLLLKDQIAEMGFNGLFEIEQRAIRCIRTGSTFSFCGLHLNAHGIRSYEGVDICWVEEAQSVSGSSWDTLLPTIRKAGSEIIMSLNPMLDTDPTYKRFVANPPDDAVLMRVSYEDNPWLSSTQLQDIEEMRRKDYAKYLHVYGGECSKQVEGAVYATYMSKLQDDGRIGRVPHDGAHPVHRAWDLGHHDSTAVWFIQYIGFEYRVVDYLEGRQRKLVDYVRDMQRKPYTYGYDYLPHDAAHQSMTGKSVLQTMRELGCKAILVPKSTVAAGIDMTRTMLDNFWFDAAACSDGIMALRHYRYEIDEATGKWSDRPKHDWSSHAADALRTFCMGFRGGDSRYNADRNKVRRSGWFGELTNVNMSDNAWMA